MRPKIYLFGDSITEESFGDGGWGASLANHFSRSVDAVLRGYSGYNTRWALKVLDKVFPEVEGGDGGEPLAVTVFFGANDACLPERCSAFQHVPLDEYKHNLLSIVSFLKIILSFALDDYTVLRLIRNVKCVENFSFGMSKIWDIAKKEGVVEARVSVDVFHLTVTGLFDWIKAS